MGRTAFTEPQCLHSGALYLIPMNAIPQTFISEAADFSYRPKHVMRIFLQELRYIRSKGKGKSKGKMHPCTGTEALYRPYGP